MKLTKEAKMKLLIQGFFYKNGRDSISHNKKLNKKGADWALKSGLFRKLMFSGIIFPDQNKSDKLVGEMMDQCGWSRLFDINVTDRNLEFSQRYNDKKIFGDLASFKFERNGDVWIGNRVSIGYDEGAAVCFTTEVPNDLFLPINSNQ